MAKRDLVQAFVELADTHPKGKQCRIKAEHTGDVYTLEEWMAAVKHDDLAYLQQHFVHREGNRIISDEFAEVSYLILDESPVDEKAEKVRAHNAEMDARNQIRAENREKPWRPLH